MRDQKKAEEIALQRLQLLSPLLTGGLDPAQAWQFKANARQVCPSAACERYLIQYRKDGLDGFRPKGRDRPPSKDAKPAGLLDQAILLRRQVPGMGRSGRAGANQSQHPAG